MPWGSNSCEGSREDKQLRGVVLVGPSFYRCSFIYIFSNVLYIPDGVILEKMSEPYSKPSMLGPIIYSQIKTSENSKDKGPLKSSQVSEFKKKIYIQENYRVRGKTPKSFTYFLRFKVPFERETFRDPVF